MGLLTLLLLAWLTTRWLIIGYATDRRAIILKAAGVVHVDSPTPLKGWSQEFIVRSRDQDLGRPLPALGEYGSGVATLWPYWLLAVPTSLFCLVGWRREIRLADQYFRRRHVIPPGHCQYCGYNLMANVSGRCPECGMPCE